jgi:hypothetical protein
MKEMISDNSIQHNTTQHYTTLYRQHRVTHLLLITFDFLSSLLLLYLAFSYLILHYFAPIAF